MGAAYKGFLSKMWQGAALSSMVLGLNTIVEFSYAADGLKGIHEKRWAYYTDPLTGEQIDTRSTAIFHRLTTNNQHFNHEVSGSRVRSSDYLRLKTIEFTYSLPEKVLRFMKLSKVMLFARGNNVLLFDYLKEFGLDPEAADNSIDIYPQSRIYTWV